VADPNQDLYDRGFFMPEGGSHWSLAELRINCRNTREIAKFVSLFGGGISASASPEGDPVKILIANSETEFVEKDLDSVKRAHLALGNNSSEVAVITGTAAERNLLYSLESSEFRFCKWEERSEKLVACETVKRAKGIEASHIVFATLNEDIMRNELYVGGSRARTDLVVIGPQKLAESLTTILMA
jgi:hypothetical protein